MEHTEPAPLPPQPEISGGEVGQEDQSLQDIFRELPTYSMGDYIHLGDIFTRLEGRGHILLLVVLGIPATLVPGVSVAFGVALAFISGQMAFGSRPFLPRFLRERKMKTSNLLRINPKLIRMAGAMERILHPRLGAMFDPPWTMRLYGGVLLVLSLLLLLPLPIPFTNSLAGIPILIVSLGLLQRDGYALIAGMVAALAAVSAFVAIFVLGAEGASHLFDRFRPQF